MGYWTHTVLELFPKPLGGDLPTEGDPADWIEKELVLYAQGDDETVVYFMPLWKILWIKAKKYAEDIHSCLYNNVWYPLNKKRLDARWDEFVGSIETVTTEELKQCMLKDGMTEEEFEEFFGD